MTNSMQVLRLSINFLVCAVLIFTVGTAHAYEKVYLKPKEALKVLFKDSEVVRSEKKELSKKERKKIEKKLRSSLSRSSYIFYVGKTGSHIDGYALIDHQAGKTRPISYIVLIGSTGKVEQVEVLAYRESHGSEVRHDRFLSQFQGKGGGDVDRLDRDISNISGATLSVRGITLGVKRALVLWDFFYGESPN